MTEVGVRQYSSADVTTRHSSDFCGLAVEPLCADLKDNLKRKKKFLQGLVPLIESPLGQKSLSAFTK